MRYRATAAQPERQFWVAKWVVPAGRADRDRPLHGDRDGQVRAHRRIQTVRGPGLSADHRRVNELRIQNSEFGMRTRILNSKFLILNSRSPRCPLACVTPHPLVHADEGTQSTRKKEPAAGLKPLKLTHAKTAKPVVGAEIDASAEGLPPNRTVDLIWETVEGGWVVEDGYRFRGKRFTDSTKVLGRAQVDCRRAARGSLHHSGRFRRRSLRHRRRCGKAAGARRHRSDADLRDASIRRTHRHARRASRHRFRVADDGEHVGGELGQSGSRLRVGHRHARHGRGAVPRDRSRGRPRDQGLHRLHGSELSESRAGAERVPAEAPVRVSRDRLAPSAAGGYAEPYQAQKMPAAEISIAGGRPEHHAGAGTGADARGAQGQRVSRECARFADLGHAGWKPGLRQRLRAARKTSWRRSPSVRMAGSTRRW